MEILNAIRSSDWRRIDILYNGLEKWSQICEWEICVLGPVKGPCLSLVLERDYTCSRCVRQNLPGSTILSSYKVCWCRKYVIVCGFGDFTGLCLCSCARGSWGFFASQEFSSLGHLLLFAGEPESNGGFQVKCNTRFGKALEVKIVYFV